MQRGYDVRVLEWWLRVYMPDQQIMTMADVLALAIKHAQLPVLEWLHQELQGDLPNLNGTADCFNPETVIWLHEHGGLHSCGRLSLPDHVWEKANFQMLRLCLTYDDEGSSFRFAEARSAVSVAIERGDFESLEWLYEYRPNLFQGYHLTHAISYVHLDTAKWMVERFPKDFFYPPFESFLKASDPDQAQSTLELVQWVLSEFECDDDEKCLTWIDHTIKYAVKSGDAEILESLYDIRMERLKTNQLASETREHFDIVLSQALLENAAANGHLAVIQWLHDNLSQGCTTKTMDAAAANGHLNVVQWLDQNRSEGCTSSAMDAAAVNNHLEVVQWLHRNRSEGCTEKAMDEAAGRGNLEMVQWLHENRSEGYSKKAMEFAACGGHLEIVKWLHENRKEGCTPKALNLAARLGHLKIVQWLHENRSNDFTTTAMNQAARNGYLDIVQFLHTNRLEGCTGYAMENAAARGHFVTFKWLHENQSEPFAPDLRNLHMRGDDAYEQILKCKALFTKHERFDWFAHKLVNAEDSWTPKSKIHN